MGRCHRIVVALNICEIIVRVKAAEEKGQSSQKNNRKYTIFEVKVVPRLVESLILPLGK